MIPENDLPHGHSTPFDAVAREYDATFTHTAVGRLLRLRVWALLRRLTANTHPTTVLELNCGTGEDALWLARQGWRVLATDISQEMVDLAREKAAQAGLEEQVRVEVCAIEEIGRYKHSPDGKGDTTPFFPSGVRLIFSNFGGLNCLSPGAIQNLSTDIQLLMPESGLFAAVVMSRFCLWETLYFLLKGKPRQAFRRLGNSPLDVRLDEGTNVSTRYYSPAEFRRLAGGGAQRTFVIHPVGFWLPPSYLHPFFEKYPRFLRLLNYLEKNCAPAWLAPFADHFFISFNPAPPLIR